MQGSIYTALADMVVEQMGIIKWNELLAQTRPASGGVYTSGEQYEDSELVNILILLAKEKNIPLEQAVQGFGEYLFKKLYDTSPVDVSKLDNLKDFLLAIDKVIHGEVKRLHPNAYLPKFEYRQENPQTLIMYYSSKRKLCHASVGLILGAAKQFNETIAITHPECMHQGASRCKLVIHFKD
ncbi:heme NO-binding domain-containing protein [Thalassomonas actiniarum]|uniref:Heme NO-binding domain-containing protein n=1 Tax=Thalassomonas actiniarum TaxID=485447 RepID=A0AAF0C3B6_9GAMM|nr:heme NO-binding domain-containing protein [Thalassomonas actiniarum]WDE01032.1 heme NO-binding domain-containing protein [Thalassomonas actiniarum]